MLKTALGVFALLLGFMALVFTVMAYSELQRAGTAATVPTADSMPLTRIVNPELFASRNAGIKPATLARAAVNRLYIIGGVSLALATFGGLVLAIPRSRGQEENESR